MEKILVPFNSSDYDAKVLEFAGYLARLTGSGITGLFLEDLGRVTNPEAIAAKKQLAEKNIGFFREGCESRSVHHNVKREAGAPVSALVAESRYADMVVIDASTSFSDTPEETPTHFVRQVLAGVECPVIIASHRFNGIDEIIFLYDGTASCMFAARQFSYLFPQFDDKKVTVIHVNHGTPVKEDDKAKMKNWVKEHYSSIGFTTLEGDPSGEMFVYLLKKKNAFVVTGAYGRNSLSQFFRHSTAEMLIKTLPHALFITHQ